MKRFSISFQLLNCTIFPNTSEPGTFSGLKSVLNWKQNTIMQGNETSWVSLSPRQFPIKPVTCLVHSFMSQFDWLSRQQLPRPKFLSFQSFDSRLSGMDTIQYTSYNVCPWIWMISAYYLPLPFLFFFPISPPAPASTSDTFIPLEALACPFLFLVPFIPGLSCTIPWDTSRRPLVLIFGFLPRSDFGLPVECF